MTKTDCTKKKCYVCGEIKPIDEFYKNKSRACGVQAACKMCHQATINNSRKTNPERKLKMRTGPKAKRRYALKKKYGITIEQYDEMYERQQGRCAICGRPWNEKRNMPVDHNHETCQVRELLCDRCNMVVGVVETNNLAPYHEYLARHQ